MKIVIDIPKEVFDEIYNENYYSLKGKEALRVAVRNCTKLPEGQYDCRTIDRVLEIIDGLNNMEKAKGYEEWNEGFDDAIKLIMDEVLALKGEQG